MKMKQMLALLLAVGMVFGIAACGSGTEEAPAEETAAETEETAEEAAPAEETAADGNVLKVGVSWAHYNDALFYAWGDGMKAVLDESCQEHGYDSVEWISVVAEDDAAKQASDISDLITQECDVIIAYAFDNKAIASSIQEAQDAGIPVVLWDRDIAADASPAPDLFVGLDTYNQAYLAGKAFFQQMIDAGETPTEIISIIGATNDNNALNRQKGFEDAAAEFDLTIAQTVPSDWDAEKALTGFTAAFQAHPDCNTVLIASDFIVPSVQTVLEANGAWHANGEEGHVWICSQDGFPTGCEFMLDGYIDYSGMYNIEAMCGDFANAIFDIIEATYTGEAQLYSEPMIVSAEEIADMPDLWGIKYAEQEAAAQE